MLKHYVRFSFPGILLNEYKTEEVAERNPELITVPEGAFAYCFFDRTEEVVDGETLIGEEKNFFFFFYFGKEYTLEEVKAQFPEYTTLISNMEYNGWNRVVRTRRGNWQHLEEKDKVI